MKHKLNSFSGAFEGTTKGLEGIVNALKREEPPPPDPNYPRYLFFLAHGKSETILKIDSPNDSELIDGGYDKDLYRVVNGIIQCKETDVWFQIASYDLNTFEIFNIEGEVYAVGYQWIDHPQ